MCETICSGIVVSGTHTCVGARSTSGLTARAPSTMATARTTATVEGSARYESWWKVRGRARFPLQPGEESPSPRPSPSRSRSRSRSPNPSPSPVPNLVEGAQLECGEEEGGDDERPLPRDHLQAGHEALQRVRAREQEVRQHRRPAHVHDRAHRRAEERPTGAERDVVVRLGVGVAEIVPHAPEQDPRVRAEEAAAHADQQPDDPAEAGHCERQP